MSLIISKHPVEAVMAIVVEVVVTMEGIKSMSPVGDSTRVSATLDPAASLNTVAPIA